MKKTKTQVKDGSGNWLGYTGMATAFLAVAPSANAQVVSVDIDPDAVVMSGSTYDVDFDGDGTFDIQISQSQTSSSSLASQVVGVNVPTGNAVLGSGASFMYPYVLGAGDPIAPGDANFKTDAFGSLDYGGSFGNWINESGYLGCRFVGGDGMNHYGWVELTVPDEFSATVMAYGYETTPDSAINAGDLGGSIGIGGNSAPLQWSLASNLVSDQAVINLPSNTEAALEIKLINSTGQVLFTDVVNNVDRYTLPLANYAPGAYFLRVQQGTRVAFRKLVKQ